MMAELPAAYSALAAERVPQLQPLAASFVDFAMWERGRLEEGGPLASQACPGTATACCTRRPQSARAPMWVAGLLSGASCGQDWPNRPPSCVQC